MFSYKQWKCETCAKGLYPVDIHHLFKVNNRSSRAKYEICSELTIKTPEQCQCCHCDIFIVNFEQNLHHIIVFYCVLITGKCSLGKV